MTTFQIISRPKAAANPAVFVKASPQFGELEFAACKAEALASENPDYHYEILRHVWPEIAELS